MVNLELYRVFCAVVSKGSLTKASEELFISQPAISQAIKQLEKQLGAKLFNRTGKGMQLTENGKNLYAQVKSALDVIKSAESRFLKESALMETLKICASDTVFNYCLLSAIKEYHEKFPQVKLQLISCTSSETIERLKDGTADVGFINLPVADDEISIIGVATTLHDGFFGGEKYKGLSSNNIPLATLQEYPLLMLETPTVTASAVIDFALACGVHLCPEIEFGSLELATASAVNDMGIVCIPFEFVKKELSLNKLYEIKTEPQLPARAIGIAVKKDSVKSRELSEFLKLVNEN